jgi:hypothetical protein
MSSARSTISDWPPRGMPIASSPRRASAVTIAGRGSWNRSTAMRARAAYGPKDSVRDALPPDVTEPFLDAIDRLIREINRYSARR